MSSLPSSTLLRDQLLSEVAGIASGSCYLCSGSVLFLLDMVCPFSAFDTQALGLSRSLTARSWLVRYLVLRTCRENPQYESSLLVSLPYLYEKGLLSLI